MGTCLSDDYSYYESDLTKVSEEITITSFHDIYKYRNRIDDDTRLQLTKYILNSEIMEHTHIHCLSELINLKNILICDEETRKNKFDYIIKTTINRLPSHIYISVEYPLVIKVYPSMLLKHIIDYMNCPKNWSLNKKNGKYHCKIKLSTELTDKSVSELKCQINREFINDSLKIEHLKTNIVRRFAPEIIVCLWSQRLIITKN